MVAIGATKPMPGGYMAEWPDEIGSAGFDSVSPYKGARGTSSSKVRRDDAGDPRRSVPLRGGRGGEGREGSRRRTTRSPFMYGADPKIYLMTTRSFGTHAPSNSIKSSQRSTPLAALVRRPAPRRGDVREGPRQEVGARGNGRAGTIEAQPLITPPRRAAFRDRCLRYEEPASPRAGAVALRVFENGVAEHRRRGQAHDDGLDTRAARILREPRSRATPLKQMV